MTSVRSPSRHLASTLGVLALWMLMAPAGASAEVSHDSLWGDAQGSCIGQSDMEEHGLASLMTRSTEGRARSSLPHASWPVRTTGNRSTADNLSIDAETSEEVTTCLQEHDAGAQRHRVCLEEADVPASIVPALVAEVRGFDRSEGVLATANRLAGGTPTDAESVSSISHLVDAPKSLPLGEIPTPPNQPDPKASCTASNPEECRSLPPRPTLEVESSPTAPNLRTKSLAFDDANPADRGDDHAAGARVRPSDGYDTPPDRPPKIVLGIRS